MSVTERQLKRAETPCADRSQFIRGGRLGVLLIHGLGGTPIELRFVAQGLARAGHTVYCCQLAGHCGTPEELRRSTWQRMVRERRGGARPAQGALRHHRCRRPVDGRHPGHCTSPKTGPTTCTASCSYAPTLKLDGWSMPWYSRVLHYLRPLPIRLRVRPHRARALRLEGRARARAWSCPACRAAMPARPACSARRCAHSPISTRWSSVVKRDLGKVRQPALIVHPRDDDMASLKNAHYLQTHLGGLVDTLVLDDSYHMVTLDQQRHIVAERTDAFRGAGSQSATWLAQGRDRARVNREVSAQSDPCAGRCVAAGRRALPMLACVQQECAANRQELASDRRWTRKRWWQLKRLRARTDGSVAAERGHCSRGKARRSTCADQRLLSGPVALAATNAYISHHTSASPGWRWRSSKLAPAVACVGNGKSSRGAGASG